MAEKPKALELKKHVAAIHSNNKLSLLQRKIANALLFNAYDDLLIKNEHEIHIPTLCNLIGYDSHDHKTIKKALVNLLSTVIEWNLVDGDKVDSEGVWNASSMIADASIDGAICSYSYSNKMKKLLHRPELYGCLNMLVQAKFQSSYGLALYENCIRYQNIEQTPWFEMDKLRKLMGVEEGRYSVFRDFKKRVLNKAVEEVNIYSPIFVTPKLQKQGRHVTAVQFIIRHDKTEQDKTEQIPSGSLSDVLKVKFGFSKTQIENTLSSYEKNYILEKIKIVESSPSFVSGKIGNLAKYLISALQDDYQTTKSTKTAHNKIHNSLSSVSKDQYDRYVDSVIMKAFESQSDADKRILSDRFAASLKGIYADLFQREGLSNPIIQIQLRLFIKKAKPELLENVVAYADCEMFHVEQE